MIGLQYKQMILHKGTYNNPLSLWERARVRGQPIDFKALIPTFSQREKEFFESLEVTINYCATFNHFRRP